MKNLILASLAAAFLSAGCATPQTVATSERAEEGDILTGSRIPRKSSAQPVKVVGPKEIEIPNTIGSQPRGN